MSDKMTPADIRVSPEDAQAALRRAVDAASLLGVAGPDTRVEADYESWVG